MLLNLNPPAPPPVVGLRAATGTGKTKVWRERVAASAVAQGLPVVLAVPRHRLGDEVVNGFSGQGISARVYRGREAADPEAPGTKMCRELDRAELISGALGSVARQGCKHGAAECAFYRECGYEAQKHKKPQVWIVPHQLLFRERPSFIPAPSG